MRYILILLLNVMLFGNSYDFDEYKFVYALGVEFKESGNFSFEGDKTIITYTEPKYKQIVSEGENVSIKGASGKIFKLKGRALFYTKLFINIMARLGNIDEIKTNRDFDVKKYGNLYLLSFKGEIEERIPKAEVKIENDKVISFKIFLKNNDTLEIVKR